MNFVFISPNFPHTYWQFCDRLHRNGINVLGIGDSPYDSLEAPLKAALTEYASPLKRYAESCGRFVKAGCVMMLLGIAQNAFGMLTARNKSGM